MRIREVSPMPRPVWRWWLCTAALSVHWHGPPWLSRWALRVVGWCVLPEWVATDEEIAHARSMEVRR